MRIEALNVIHHCVGESTPPYKCDLVTFDCLLESVAPYKCNLFVCKNQWLHIEASSLSIKPLIICRCNTLHRIHWRFSGPLYRNLRRSALLLINWKLQYEYISSKLCACEYFVYKLCETNVCVRHRHLRDRSNMNQSTVVSKSEVKVLIVK